MGIDYQAVGVVTAGVLTAVGAVFTGFQTGRTGRNKDRQDYETRMEAFRVGREAAEEVASRGRVEALAADSALARMRLREAEQAHYEETQAWYKTRRALEYDVQRGWDTARFHFGILTTVVHIMTNVFQVLDLAGDDYPRVVNTLRNAVVRMRDIRIPASLEEPIPNTRKTE